MLFTEMKQYAKALHYQQKLSTSADGYILASNWPHFLCRQATTEKLCLKIKVNSFNIGEYSKAFESMKNTFQPIHPNFGMYHKNMALLYYDMKQYSKARQHFEKVLDLIQKLFPSNYVELLVYSSRICEIYIEMSDSFKAQTTFQQCMRIEQLAAAINMQTYGWEDYIVQ